MSEIKRTTATAPPPGHEAITYGPPPKRWYEVYPAYHVQKVIAGQSHELEMRAREQSIEAGKREFKAAMFRQYATGLALLLLGAASVIYAIGQVPAT